MGIHDSKNNLEEINNSSKNTEVFEINSHDNLEEMNPYANNIEHIHDEVNNDNIVINNEELDKPEQPENVCNEYFKADLIKTLIANQNKKIRFNQFIDNRKNNIMRSVTIHQQYVKSRYKQLISAAKSKKYLSNTASGHRLDNIKNKHNIVPFKSGRFKTLPIAGNAGHRLDNIRNNHNDDLLNNVNFIREQRDDDFIREQPDVDNTVFITQIPHKALDNFQLRDDPINLHEPSFNRPRSLNYRTISPTIEKPKDIEKPNDVNLAEIITASLQDILAGKITTIENVIGKIRVDFEEKNVFANSNKRNVILLNFEDDTMRPVLKIDEKYMNIIEQWYNTCEIFFDIEETYVSIPESITIQDVSGVLFQDINYKFKDEYLNSYIPLVINNIISERTTKSLEKKYFKNQIEYKTPIIKPKHKIIKNPIDIDKIISDLGITIPENIIPETNTANATSNINFAFDPTIFPQIQRIDPEILIKKHILTDIKDTESNDNIIHPFNEVSSFNIVNGDNFTCYNSRYDSLYPKFSDNCLILDEFDGKKPCKEVSYIYVLINNKFLQTITFIDPNADILYIINNYPEFGFIKLFGIETNNKDIIDFIEKEFNKSQFINVDEINKKLWFTSQFIEFSNTHNKSINIASSEENQVKHFFDMNYTINNDINHKMKASNLYDSIIMSNFVKLDNDKLSGFRTRLSKYLKDIGLQKKRYNDGFYYYGIVKKDVPAFSSYNTNDNNQHFTIEELINKRDEEIKDIRNKRDEEIKEMKNIFG